MIQDEAVPLLGGTKVELRLYVPPIRQTTDPGPVAEAADESDLGEEELAPEPPPKGDAKIVQSDAPAPLFTAIETGELVAESLAESVTCAVIVWAPLLSKLVFSEKIQLEVPDADEYAPPSTATWTELMDTLSDAVPATETVPETVAPLAGELIVTAGEGVTALTLMPRLADAESDAASFTCTVKAKDPAVVGVPLIPPPGPSERLAGKVPETTLQA